jgi:hypothetical protein
MSKQKKEFGWFTGGGFEKDPFLTKEDKAYYREKLDKEPKEPKEPKESKDSLF